MTQSPLRQNAEVLGAEIAQASPEKRQRLQPEFNRILARLKAEGVRIPNHLRELDAELLDEMIEARFDNMPV